MSDTHDLIKTPFYDFHIKAGAKMVGFAGFHMPVQYKGITAEHLAVRSNIGLFDLSHMGEFEVSGSGARLGVAGVVVAVGGGGDAVVLVGPAVLVSSGAMATKMPTAPSTRMSAAAATAIGTHGVFFFGGPGGRPGAFQGVAAANGCGVAAYGGPTGIEGGVAPKALGEC